MLCNLEEVETTGIRDSIACTKTAPALRCQRLTTNDQRLRNNLRRNALRYERLDHIANLDIAVVSDRDAALHAVAHFAGIIFEAAQRTNFSFEHNHVVAEQSYFGVALHDAVDHLAACNRADFGDAEGFANFRASLVSLLDSGFEQATHSALDLVLQFVNDRVQADVDLVLF